MSTRLQEAAIAEIENCTDADALHAFAREALAVAATLRQATDVDTALSFILVADFAVSRLTRLLRGITEQGDAI